MEYKNKQSMAVWRRPHRGPCAMDITIVFVLFFLLNYFRAWSIDYSSSQAKTPSPDMSKDMAGTPEAPYLEDTPADNPKEDISFEVSVAQMPVPPPGSKRIPKKIWYKLGASGLSYDTRGWTSTCISQNPECHAEFLTDQSADSFVRGKYIDRPDIVGTHDALTIPILKADMLRYLLLYAEGGVWFDLDVSCEGVPIDEWIPEEFREDVSLVAGWEFDAGFGFLFER
jgi:mannosyltransferase OCH1-like enzyme